MNRQESPEEITARLGVHELPPAYPDVDKRAPRPRNPGLRLSRLTTW
jgi:hypothetical protein